MRVARWLSAIVLATAIAGPAAAAVITDEATFDSLTDTTMQTFDGIMRNAAVSQSFTNPDFTAREVGNLPALSVRTRGEFVANNPDADTNRVLGYDRTPASSRLEFDLPDGTTAFGFHIESVQLEGQDRSGVWTRVLRGTTLLDEFYFEHGVKFFFGFTDPDDLDPLSFVFFEANGVGAANDPNFEGQVRVLLDNIKIGTLDGEEPPPGVIPLPAALPLLGGALAVMGFMGWRKRHTS